MIKTTHKDHEITYGEYRNEWEWDDKKYKSLTDAKGAIDAMEASNRRRNVPAIIFDGNGWQYGTVTSIDSDPNYCWVSLPDVSYRNRRKMMMKEVFQDCPQNRGRIEQWNKFKADERKAAIEAAKILSLMIPVRE